MKTFKTEKKNIPGGATHYINETSFFHFSWGKYVNGELVLCRHEGEWSLVDEKTLLNSLKPIPKAKEVEWVKVHNSEAIKAVMNGSCDYRCEFTGKQLTMDSSLQEFCCASRRDEVEIDEREAFIDEARKYGSWEEMYDSGKFKLADGE